MYCLVKHKPTGKYIAYNDDDGILLVDDCNNAFVFVETLKTEVLEEIEDEKIVTATKEEIVFIKKDLELLKAFIQIGKKIRHE